MLSYLQIFLCSEESPKEFSCSRYWFTEVTTKLMSLPALLAAWGYRYPQERGQRYLSLKNIFLQTSRNVLNQKMSFAVWAVSCQQWNYFHTLSHRSQWKGKKSVCWKAHHSSKVAEKCFVKGGCGQRLWAMKQRVETGLQNLH